MKYSKHEKNNRNGQPFPRNKLAISLWNEMTNESALSGFGIKSSVKKPCGKK